MQKDDATKEFKLREFPATFRSLPRVLRLVWDASPQLVAGMAFIMLLQGITPLANVIVARLLIDGALSGITRGTIEPSKPIKAGWGGTGKRGSIPMR